LRKIESLAFSYCRRLREFVIPTSAEEIEEQWTGTYTPDLVFCDSAAGLKRMAEKGSIDLAKEYRMKTSRLRRPFWRTVSRTTIGDP
jgi:hypothetical protein